MHTEETKKKISLAKKGSIPWNKGLKYSDKQKKNIVLANKKIEKRKKLSKAVKDRIDRLGYRYTDEQRKKLSDTMKEKGIEPKIKFVGKGKDNPSWIIDRTKIKDGDKEKLSYRYQLWARDIKNRDGWKCKINNKDCCGRLEAHHILPWSQFPELRYNINNGITLCHFHHPRKKIDVKKLIPVFKELVKTTV